MNVAWDYTELAGTYDRRPDYADRTIDTMIAKMSLTSPGPVLDVGAGTGKLARPLLQRGFKVFAVEPNDAMRALGIQNTQNLGDISWREGVAESTGQADASVAAVVFGSSFNVCDQARALAEVARVLRPRGWFGCLWNHRDLDDPLQRSTEAMIRRHIPDYGYGKRREDPSEAIRGSRRFEQPIAVETAFTVKVCWQDFVEAWRSHGTLARQAGDRFAAIVDEIAAQASESTVVPVPYVTRAWIARLR